MRCYICDSLLATPVWNSLYKAYEPCPSCMDIIHNVFEDTPEQLSLEMEDEEDVVEGESSSDGVGDSDPSPFEYIGKEGLTR